MREKHVQEKLSAYLNHELPKEERQTIAEHLLLCEDCRNEHDEIKFGVMLANQLQRADAPAGVWNAIENTLNGEESKQNSLIPHFSFFHRRGFVAAALLIGVGLIAAIYIGLFGSETPEIAKNELPIQNPITEQPQSGQTPTQVATDQNASAQQSSNINTNSQSLPLKTNSNSQILTKSNPIEPAKIPIETISTQNNLPSWNVETIAGMPTAGNETISANGKLAVGQFLETDANSRARVQVANIGQVEVAPNSRVQLVKTRSTEHRLSLERGLLKAKIFAPPRLFIVDTPSAVAVDLGCEYTLEVDEAGNSRLHVTAGFVALERDGRESIVPAGAVCLTKKGKGLGTPFSADASAELQKAVFNFDFQNGGTASVDSIIKESNVYDAITLWHLLSRTSRSEREKVFEALASLVKLPKGVTREGILLLDKKMLDQWWTEIENVWFG